MKFYSHHLFAWSLASAMFLLTPAIAKSQNTANYIGLGATDEGFAVNAKIELAENLSLRPAVLTDVEFDDDTEVTIIVPVSYDFESPFKNGKLLPFAGGGIGGTTRDDGSIGLTVFGGMDYLASDKLTANGSVIYLPFDSDRVNIMVGLGYNF